MSTTQTKKYTLYIHESPHRIVPRAKIYSLSDQAETSYRPYVQDKYLNFELQMRSKGAQSSSALLEEVMIAARRALKANGGGLIIQLDGKGSEVKRTRVMGCKHKNNVDSYHTDLICKDCGQHF